MRPILAVTINYIYMERTYVFNQEPNGGGSKFDIMALLPNLMGGKGVDPGLLALLNQGRNNQDAWGVERKKRFNIHFALCPDKYGILAVIFRFVVCLMM